MLWMRPDGSDSALFPGARMETSGIVYTKKHSMQKDRREQTAGYGLPGRKTEGSRKTGSAR